MQIINGVNTKMLHSKELASNWRSYFKLKRDGYSVSKPKPKDVCNTFIYNQSGFKLVEEDGRYYLVR